MHFAFLFYAPDPILWQWGFLSIRWYGVIMAIAVFLAIKLSQFLAKYKGIDQKLMAYLASWLMVGSLIFSRLFYLLFYHKTAINWWAIKGGGLSIYGALLGSFIATWLFARYNQIQLGKIIDILVPSLALGQAIGLWGHFFNNEAYGFPTNVVWRLYIPITQRPEAFINYQYFHPTFLYESILNLFIFFMLIWLFFKGVKSNDSKQAGKLGFIYLILFALTKLIIESLQIHSLMLGSIKIYWFVNFLLLIIGMMGLIASLFSNPMPSE